MRDVAAHAIVQRDGGQKRPRFGLTGRVLLLIVAFVMLAEIAIYVPSIANFRNGWLRDRLSSAYTAALVFEAAPTDMVPEELAREVLDSVGALTIAVKRRDSRRLLAASDNPPITDERYDLRSASAWSAIASAFRALAAQDGRKLSVVGDAPMGGEFIEITLDETPLRRAMIAYSRNILLLSLVISGVVAGLAGIAIHLMVLRPVRRLTSSLIRFGADPEDASRIIKPSGSTHEIGLAENALAETQAALVHELNQSKHLAALGLAVAKINHDLRNMLSSAQLLSDRLADSSDPLAKNLAPRLISTLDRAIAFCQSTLTYGRAIEQPPKLAPLDLRGIATEAIATVSPDGARKIEIRNDVAERVTLSADGEQLLRVLVNLLRNALEALESAGPQPGQTACVTIEGMFEGGKIVVHVHDTGPGIPERAREFLFEAFRSARRPGGTGLGLAIAADLIRAHGGEIVLMPQEPEKGAKFRIVLPGPDDGQEN